VEQNGGSPRARWRARLRLVILAIVLGLVLGYVVIALGAGVLFRKMLYPAPLLFPSRVPPDATLVETRAADGVTVRALSFDGPRGAPVVVHFHGNGETMGHDVWVARELSRRGLGVLLVEYRGYGLSRGEPSPTEDGLYADAAAALDWLESNGIGRERVVLWGQSLGSGVAAEMAARGRARAVVLVTPYTSIADVASRFAPRILWLRLVVRDRYDTLSKAPKITQPALVVHGNRDELIPYEMGVRLSKVLPRAVLYTVEGGHHGDLVAVDAAGVFEAVAKLARE
jgi:uncharacterized protein